MFMVDRKKEIFMGTLKNDDINHTSNERYPTSQP